MGEAETGHWNQLLHGKHEKENLLLGWPAGTVGTLEGVTFFLWSLLSELRQQTNLPKQKLSLDSKSKDESDKQYTASEILG